MSCFRTRIFTGSPVHPVLTSAQIAILTTHEAKQNRRILTFILGIIRAGFMKLNNDARSQESLQLLVLFPCFDQNRNVRVCVFPQREEILVSGTRFWRVAPEHSGARQA